MMQALGLTMQKMAGAAAEALCMGSGADTALGGLLWGGRCAAFVMHCQLGCVVFPPFSLFIRDLQFSCGSRKVKSGKKEPGVSFDHPLASLFGCLAYQFSSVIV